jgi:hypothetical protein
LGRSDRVPAPAALGLVKPLILLPSDLLGQLNAEELDQIVLHEAAHLGRWDDWLNLIQQIVGALFWLHPGVRWVSVCLALERELACDDWVLSATKDPRMFARCLVRLAELLRASTELPLAPGILTRMNQLSTRVEAMLNENRPASLRLSRTVCLAMILLLPGALWMAVSAPPLVRAEQIPASLQQGGESATVEKPRPRLQDAGDDQRLERSNPFGSGKQSNEGPREGDPTAGERDTILEQIRLAERQLKLARDGSKAGTVAEEEVLKIQREVVALKRELLAYDERKTVRTDLIADLAVPAEAANPAEEMHSRKLREQVVASLVEMVRNETNSSLRVIALVSLLRLQAGVTPDFLSELVLKDPDLDVRKVALDFLAHRQTSSNVDLLLHIYDQLGPADQKLKIVIIGSFGARSEAEAGDNKLEAIEKVVRKLQAIAKDPSAPELRKAAIERLGAIAQKLAGGP